MIEGKLHAFKELTMMIEQHSTNKQATYHLQEGIYTNLCQALLELVCVLLWGPQHIQHGLTLFKSLHQHLKA